MSAVVDEKKMLRFALYLTLTNCISEKVVFFGVEYTPYLNNHHSIWCLEQALLNAAHANEPCSS